MECEYPQCHGPNDHPEPPIGQWRDRSVEYTCWIVLPGFERWPKNSAQASDQTVAQYFLQIEIIAFNLQEVS